MVSLGSLFRFVLCVTVVGAFLPSVHGAIGDHTWDEDVLMADQDLDSQLQQYSQTTLYRHPTRRQVFAANCEDAPQWWGRFCVFHQTGGKVDWVAKVPALYRQWEGMYIVSLHWHHLVRLRRDVLAVVTSTHMGNGFLWLFELKGTELRTLLRTPASGYADTPALRRGLPVGITRFSTPITMSIRKPGKGGPEFVQFTATLTVEDNTTNEILARGTKTQTWRWDSKACVFRFRSQRQLNTKRRTVSRAPFVSE